MLLRPVDPKVAKTFLRENRAIKRTINAGIALVSAAIICAATRPDIASSFIKLMTGH